MEKVFASITGFSDVKVQYNPDTGDLDVIYYDKDKKHIRIPVSLLSDGYRCTIVVADIAYRMALLNSAIVR